MNIFKIAYITLIAIVGLSILYAAYFKINNGPAIEVNINLDKISDTSDTHYIKSIDYKFNKKSGIYTDNTSVDNNVESSSASSMDLTSTTRTSI